MQLSTIDLERCTLGAAILDPLAADRVCALLTPGDFTEPLHRDVFAALAALTQARSAVDPVTLAAALGPPSRMAPIFDLTASVSGSGSAAHHAGLVLAGSKLRALRTVGVNLAHSAEHSTVTGESVEHVLAQLFEALDQVTSRTPGKNPIRLCDAEPDLLPRILDDRETPNGVPTGFADIDRGLGGLRDGEMIVLAARPSVGKSLLAANIAENLTMRESRRAVLFLSLEMSNAQLYRRYLFARASVNAKTAFEGSASHTDKDALQGAHDDLRFAPWYVHHQAALTVPHAHALARRFRAKHGPCVVIVDYLQLMHGPGVNRTEQVTNLSAGMKSIAVDIDCPVLVLSQLNRQAADARERGGQTRVTLPTLSDLRDSGAIEQDADVVLFLARDTARHDPHPCEFVIAKNRPGRTGHTQLLFDVTGPRFRTLSNEWKGEA